MGYRTMDETRCSFCGETKHLGKRIKRNNNHIILVRKGIAYPFPSCLYGKYVKITPITNEEAFQPRGELEHLRKENRKLKQKLANNTARYRIKIKEPEQTIRDYQYRLEKTDEECINRLRKR